MSKVFKGVTKILTGGLAGLVGGGKSPSVTPAVVPDPIPTPTIDDARVAQQEQDQLTRKRGRASTVLTGASGDPTAPKLGASAALGY